jgi:hypothetical protein
MKINKPRAISVPLLEGSTHLCARIQNSASRGVSIGFRNEKGLEERPKAIIRTIFRSGGLWKGKED